jgi:hypothetical protein
MTWRGIADILVGTQAGLRALSLLKVSTTPGMLH